MGGSFNVKKCQYIDFKVLYKNFFYIINSYKGGCCMHPKKKYIMQLCEVSEETLHKSAEEKIELFKTNNGIFKNEKIFINHESILVSPPKNDDTVRECITGRKIPLVTLDIYRNLDRKLPSLGVPYAYYVNGDFKTRIFAFQIVYHDMGYLIENNTYNRILICGDPKERMSIKQVRKLEQETITNFLRSKDMTFEEYQEHLNKRLAILDEKESKTLGESLKRIMNFQAKKK